jgi:lysophospholipase L1-like esterase
MASGTFTAVGNSASVDVAPGQMLSVEITGTFVATIFVDKFMGSSAWQGVAELKRAGGFDSRSTGLGTYRLRCYSYTSGTASYRITADAPIVGRTLPANSVLATSSVDGPSVPVYTDLFFAGRQNQLRKWRSSMGRVRAGTGRSRLVCIGDSNRGGLGAGSSGTTNSVGAYAKSPVRALAQRLAALGVAVSDNSFMGDQGMITLPTAYGSYDPRITLGANHSHPTGGSTQTLAGQMFLYTTGAVNNMTFTPVGAFDTLKVFNARAGSNGSFAVNVDGGATLATITTNGGNAIIENTVSGITKATHTVNFVPSNNGNYYTIGAIAYDSTTPAVDIIQAGWAGALIASFNIASSAWHPKNMLAFLAPDLTLIQLTINDSNAGTSIESYTTTLQAIVTTALISGDCIIESGVPSGTTNATNGTLAALVAAARGVAARNNIPFIDIDARWTDYATSNALGWMFDTLHPNAVGYQDIAQAEASILALV